MKRCWSYISCFVFCEMKWKWFFVVEFLLSSIMSMWDIVPVVDMYAPLHNMTMTVVTSNNVTCTSTYYDCGNNVTWTNESILNKIHINNTIRITVYISTDMCSSVGSLFNSENIVSTVEITLPVVSTLVCMLGDVNLLFNSLSKLLYSSLSNLLFNS